MNNLTEMILPPEGEVWQLQRKNAQASTEWSDLLFNDAEAEADSTAPEPVVKDDQGYKRRNPKSKQEERLKDLSVKEILCEIHEDDQNCLRCNTLLRPIGKETVREELEYIPAKLQIIRYVRMAYECTQCKHTDTPYIEKALTPSPLMAHSLASSSTVAHVMYQKYANAMPLYRQEKDWEQLGFALSRATMANWIIRCSQDYLDPIIVHLREKLRQREILHCDETPVQVLKEEGKKPQSKSTMWLYRTGNDEKPPIILYDYQKSKSGENALNCLKGFNGFLHSDGYAGYNRLKDVTRCGCWAHLRRKFVEAAPTDKWPENRPPTPAEVGRDYCNRLFKIEETLSALSPDERYLKRLELEKQVLEAFWCWIDTLKVLQGSAFGKAVIYARNQRRYMENYILDGRCLLSNNLAENSIRPFTVGRKNWLF
ncbi:IS66 family transposase [Acetobacterium malicum]|uniref:IS66 family transposase n=1 Tax=Acetobacterium malicum TaxID=52692 RepID=UPI003593C538